MKVGTVLLETNEVCVGWDSSPGNKQSVQVGTVLLETNKVCVGWDSCPGNKGSVKVGTVLLETNEACRLGQFFWKQTKCV